ncbi:hypothetical protein NM688_g335 [Phlebia brevispora]|uniref:Uncharacterized protein n=1 Tax=Phlebia brevispora TaxID=194682 RepID=A0ACC1TEH1_9APHY|nr:hypothetical protein NM688_g335 [Phlebia brevispora]
MPTAFAIHCYLCSHLLVAEEFDSTMPFQMDCLLSLLKGVVSVSTEAPKLQPHHSPPLVLPGMRIEAPPIPISMTGKLVWNLVFEYDNTQGREPAFCPHVQSRSTYIKRNIFDAVLNLAVTETLTKSGQQRGEGTVYEATAIEFVESVPLTDTPYLHDELENALEGLISVPKGSSGYASVVETTRSEPRLYTADPGCAMSIYQLRFVAPGIEHSFNVYTGDLTGKDNAKSLSFRIKASIVVFIQSIEVRYDSLQPDMICVQEDTRYRSGDEQKSRNDNINSPYGPRSYAYLLPVYTLNKSKAATAFELSNETRNKQYYNSRPQYPEVPQIESVARDVPFRVCEVALLRSQEELKLNPQWGYDGITADINGNNRKGLPVHLGWKSRYVGL